MAANYPKGEKYYSQRELDAAVAAAEQKGRLEGAIQFGHSEYAAGVKAASDAVDAVGQRHPKWDLMGTHYEGCWKHHSECALTLALAAIDALRGEANAN